MKKFLIFLSFLFFGLNLPAEAITITPTASPSGKVTSFPETIITLTPTPEVKEKITEPKSEEAKGKFAALLAEQKVGPLSPFNFLKHSIRFAVSRGVPANTIVLILLLPLVAALVGFIQYFVGLPGFGIFMPAMIAITFLATGILGGLILFAVILISTILAGKAFKKAHLYYWPRRAITLMTISLITFFFFLLSPLLGLFDLTQISIFPILFLILLSEEFTRTQLGKSKGSAISLTLGTLIISIIGASLMSWEPLQKVILLNPEISFLSVLIINILIGKYSGWRLLEYKRFKSLLDK